MSSIKDALMSAQSGNNRFPQINAVPVEIKESKKGAAFTVYKKETKENEVLKAPIKGILIGVAMQAGAYSDSLGKNGGNYKTAYYLTNKNIILFAPTSKGYEIVCRGSMENIENFITKEAGTNTKKKQVLFVLTENGLYGFINNLSIGIDQYGVHKEALTEKYIILTPKTFEESDKNISKKAKEYLGKFRTKNPPKFAEITVGELITEEDFEAWGAIQEIENYTKWKAHVTQGATEQTAVAPLKPAEEFNNENAEKPQQTAYSGTTNASEDNQDLPF